MDLHVDAAAAVVTHGGVSLDGRLELFLSLCPGSLSMI